MVSNIFYACMALIFLASISVWRWGYDRYSRFKPILETRPNLASPIGLVDVVAMLGVWLASQLMAGEIFSAITGISISELNSATGGNMMLLSLIHI